MFARRSRTEQLFQETRQFTRDMMRRMELVTDAHVRAIDKIAAEVADLTAESRAQREALLKVIDRMDRMDPGSASA